MAGAILRDAARSSCGVFVVEGFERGPLGFAPFSLAGLPALLANPILAPRHKIAKAAMTWLSPIALGASIWDGLVSRCASTRRPSSARWSRRARWARATSSRPSRSCDAAPGSGWRAARKSSQGERREAERPALESLDDEDAARRTRCVAQDRAGHLWTKMVERVDDHARASARELERYSRRIDRLGNPVDAIRMARGKSAPRSIWG